MQRRNIPCIAVTESPYRRKTTSENKPVSHRITEYLHFMPWETITFANV